MHAVYDMVDDNIPLTADDTDFTALYPLSQQRGFYAALDATVVVTVGKGVNRTIKLTKGIVCTLRITKFVVSGSDSVTIYLRMYPV